MAMAEAVLTPLGPLFGGRRLADIPSRDRLVEAKFDLQLATQDPIEMKDVARLMAEHLADSDPFRKYADSWARSKVQLNGSLYGEIDAVFRIGEEPTFIVTDYKTNLLHQSGSANALEDYEPSKLDGAMMSNDYVLQALLYSVALHRYLNLRLPNYQPERHLGGVAYFFLRGMVGENTPCTLDGRPYGVATWKPPLALIDALDGLFSARQVEKAS
jgi:exodeoxyribonuclease V beta subunit